MFRVKKEDYNTIQFMPEYNSSHVTSNHKQLHSGRGKSIALIVIIVLVVIAVVAGGIAYFTYFSPRQQFERAFAAGDYEKCSEICQDNAFDSGFVSGITDTVTAAQDDIMTKYKEGTLGGTEATAQLQNLADITNGGFTDSIQASMVQIQNIEGLSDILGQAESSCIAEQYNDAIDYIKQLTDASAQYGKDFSSDVSNLIEQYMYGFKNSLFTQYSTQIKAKNYDAIRESANFILGYVSDADFADFLTTVQEVENGDTSAASASKTAKNVARQAKNDAAAQMSAADDHDPGLVD